MPLLRVEIADGSTGLLAAGPLSCPGPDVARYTDEALSSGLVLAERLGDIVGMGSRRRVHPPKTTATATATAAGGWSRMA